MRRWLGWPPGRCPVPEFRAWRTCELCGYAANEPEVQPSVVRMPDELDGRGHVLKVGAVLPKIRCRRVDDCQRRAKAAGRPWPYEVGRKPSDEWRRA